MLKWLPPCSPSIIGKSIWDADEVFYSWHFVTQSGPDTFAKRYSFTDDASPTTRHNTLSDVPINRIFEHSMHYHNSLKNQHLKALDITSAGGLWTCSQANTKWWGLPLWLCPDLPPILPIFTLSHRSRLEVTIADDTSVIGVIISSFSS